MRWNPSTRPPRARIIDHCVLCSAPVYEAQRTFRFLGLHVHPGCYRRETEFPDPETRRSDLTTA